MVFLCLVNIVRVIMTTERQLKLWREVLSATVDALLCLFLFFYPRTAAESQWFCLYIFNVITLSLLEIVQHQHLLNINENVFHVCAYDCKTWSDVYEDIKKKPNSP